MDLTVISAVVAASIAVTSLVGGLLLKAFINPVKNKTELNATTMHDHDNRIRELETLNATHSVHLENLMKAVDRLVNKIDELVSYEKHREKD